jgi:hypothetical protein
VSRRGRGGRSSGLALAVLALVALGAPRPAAAQLISPGKLAKAHAGLDGVEHCTECHELGKPGADDARCLACHKPLATRIAAKQGLHATYTAQRCADCHKDHFGPDFALVRLDSASFDHAKTGYPLRQAHDTVACRSCHRPENITAADVRAYAAQHAVLATTDLGLSHQCASCHHKDDPHGAQFAGRACDACHDEASWKKAPGFDHRKTRYPLTGAHDSVPCAKCHTAVRPNERRSPVRYAGVPFAACSDCHTDPHHGVMRGACASCHNTANWRRLDSRAQFEATFDHSRTTFSLVGAHAKAKCAACHQPRAPGDTLVRLQFAKDSVQQDYPRPAAATCVACHLDAHHDEFARAPGGATCDNCHGQDGWLPTTYGIARHNRETYALTGAHLTVPCEDCHVRREAGTMPELAIARHECADCHERGSGETKNPHGDQFAGRGCRDCHDTAAFKIAAFDHARTRYPLDGAHRHVPCASCHKTEMTAHGPMVRYRPLATDCRSCHGAAG